MTAAAGTRSMLPPRSMTASVTVLLTVPLTVPSGPVVTPVSLAPVSIRPPALSTPSASAAASATPLARSPAASRCRSSFQSNRQGKRQPSHSAWVIGR